MTAITSASTREIENAQFLLHILQANVPQNAVVVEQFIKRLKGFVKTDHDSQRDILAIVLSSLDQREKFQHVKTIFEKSLGVEFSSVAPSKKLDLIWDAFLSREAILSLPQFHVRLSPTETQFHKFVVSLGIPSEIAELYQYRTKIGDTIYHFWADTHRLITLNKSLADHFSKDPDKERTVCLEGGSEFAKGVYPIEPNRRGWLIEKFVHWFFYVEKGKDYSTILLEFCAALFDEIELMHKSLFLWDHWEKHAKGTLMPYVNTIADIVGTDGTLREKSSLMQQKIPQKKFAEIAFECAKMLANDKSIPESARQKLKDFQQNYKKPDFDLNWDLGVEEGDIRDRGMAEQMFRKRKAGVSSFGFLGFKHLAGVIKYLRILHNVDKVSVVENKEGKESEGRR